MMFNVYRDLNHNYVWGNSIGSLISGSIPAGDSNQTLTVYGKIPAGQNTLKAGSYSGSMTIILTYNP